MHTLEENLKVLTSKAFDIETQVKNVELLGKKKRTAEVGNWLEKVAKLNIDFVEMEDAEFRKPLMHGSYVKKLIEGVGELAKQSETFHELVTDGSETSGVRLFTASLHSETFKVELDKVLAWLEAKADQVPCIGIYGMGGVGKTTLAKNICMHLQDKPDNIHVYWLTVSQEVDINKLQEHLAKQLNLDLPKDDDVEEKAGILNRVLREKKNVVLIFDDVWKYFDLSMIGIPLGVDGCRVIITSQLLHVCNLMGCNKYIIKVQPLSEEDAWKLFLEKLDCANELSSEVEEVAKITAKKCDRLPLAIITLASSMSGVSDIHQWKKALNKLNESPIEQIAMKIEVLPVLQNSYNHLDDLELQHCFLYCSLYPKDYEIPRDELITRFIYEGLMRQRDNRAEEFDQGHTILNRLVNSCLLESVVNYMGKECVKMHDLLREMAIKITRNNPRFMTKVVLQLDELPGEQEWKDDLERVSLMYNKIIEIPEGSSPRCPRLSTLILKNNPLKLIPDSFFAHMHGLRVLDLTSTDIEELPDSISELENLTALLLRCCYKLCYVPSLRKLKTLMELDISWTRIREVPDGMEYLVKLKCLNMEKTKELIEFPRGLLPRLSHLESLLLPFHIKIQVEEVESLKLLEKFQGWVDDMFNSKWLNKSPPLSFYRIIAGGDNSKHRNHFFHESAIKLEECGFKTSGDVLLLPQNIQHIDIRRCKGFSDCLLDSIQSMDLKECRIEECDEIESIMRISTSSNNEGALQNLEKLFLHDLKIFIGCFKWEERALALPPRGTFSSLQVLLISGCDKIKNLFSNQILVQNLHNLEEIAIAKCHQMKEIIADDEEDEGVGSTSSSSNNNKYTNIIPFPKLRSVWLHNLSELESIYKGTIDCCDSIEEIGIVNCPKIKRLPFVNPSLDKKPTILFPKLEKLYLCDLPEVKSICNGIMICDSIKAIDIRGCKQLSRLPLYLPLIDGQLSPPSSLEKIWINETEKEWWKSLEWDHPKSNNVLHPFLKYL